MALPTKEQVLALLRTGTVEERAAFLSNLPPARFKDVAGRLFASEDPRAVVLAVLILLQDYCNGTNAEMAAILAAAGSDRALEIGDRRTSYLLAAREVAALALLGRSDEVLAATERYYDFRLDLDRRESVPELTVRRFEALVHLKRFDEAREEITRQELWQRALELESLSVVYDKPWPDAQPSPHAGSLPEFLQRMKSTLQEALARDERERLLRAPASAAAEPYDDELRIRAPPVEPAGRDERRVHAAILQSGRKRKTFVAGAENVIRCWIGLPEKEAAFAAEPIPTAAIPADGLQLVAQLYWRDGSGIDHTDRKPLLLPAERTARSGDCDLRLQVPDGERYVSAEILFRYRGRVFEAVRVEGFACAAGDVEPQSEVVVRVQVSRREVIALPDSHPVAASFVFGGDARASAGVSLPPSLRVFGREGVRNFDLKDAKTAIAWLNEILFSTEKLVARRKAAATTVQEKLDPDDADVCALLRQMARHGAALYNDLVNQGFEDPGEHIQILNHESDAYVPLEFVYDRGYPVSSARLCAAGLQALGCDVDACSGCSVPVADDQRASADVICPFGFWSLRKIIERVPAAAPGEPSAPTVARRNLPAFDSLIFASSHLVPEEERNATRETLLQSFGQHLFLANDWNQWRDGVKARPSLLMLLAHHGIDGKLDYLQIGDEGLPEDLGRLSRAQVLKSCVNADGRDPGPVVLLLGCQTGATTETGYVGLTQLFQQQHAAIVVGTLAEILGRDAAPLARELVAELVAVRNPETTFGMIMRAVRRRMLARGCLLALCLVALGDAEWRLTPRPPAGEP